MLWVPCASWLVISLSGGFPVLFLSIYTAQQLITSAMSPIPPAQVQAKHSTLDLLIALSKLSPTDLILTSVTLTSHTVILCLPQLNELFSENFTRYVKRKIHNQNPSKLYDHKI